MGCFKSGHTATNCHQSRYPMENYQCGSRRRGRTVGAPLTAKECWEKQYSEYMHRLIKVQDEVKIMKPLAKSYRMDDSVEKESAQRVGEEMYPIILSPYSSCWWKQQPDPVIPPIITGLQHYYRGRLGEDACALQRPKGRWPAIGPAKRPTFDTVPKGVLTYWHCRPGRTDYDDSISFTGYMVLRRAQQHREPIPSCRRRTEDRPY